METLVEQQRTWCFYQLHCFHQIRPQVLRRDQHYLQALVQCNCSLCERLGSHHVCQDQQPWLLRWCEDSVYGYPSISNLPCSCISPGSLELMRPGDEHASDSDCQSQQDNSSFEDYYQEYNQSAQRTGILSERTIKVSVLMMRIIYIPEFSQNFARHQPSRN